MWDVTVNELYGLKAKHKNIKLSTKIKNLVKTCTYHKKDFRICKSLKKQHKLSGSLGFNAL